jgi:uncharacterized protein (TIGR02145 family)
VISFSVVLKSQIQVISHQNFKIMKQKILISIFIFLMAAGGFAQSGEITVTSVEQRSDGSGLVDVHFDLNATGNNYYVNLRVSFDTGVNYYPIKRNTFSGDTGPVNPGNSKHIVWNPTVEFPDRYSPQTKLQLIANYIDQTNSCPGTPTVVDIDGNVYGTVQIGNQCWMASNLNVTRKPNGAILTRYCYDNNTLYCDLYGGLYTWQTMMNGAGSSNSNPSGVQGICPTGWHVPSDSEWNQLTNYLINYYPDINSDNVGNKLKSCRQVNSPLGGDCNTTDHPRWTSHSTHYGTNDFGFSALPGGYYSGSFSYLGTYAYWWTATEHSGTNAWSRYMGNNIGSVYRYNTNKTYGFSVRCLRD